MDKTSKTYQLIVIAIFIAIEVILTRFLSIQTPVVRIGFGFLPVAMLGILYGPVWAGMAYAVGDVLGMLIWPTANYFPGFTLTAFLTGFTFGLILYKRKITIPRVMLASAIVVLLLNLCLDTLWLSILFGRGYWALMPARLVKVGITFTIQVILIPIAYHSIIRTNPYFRRQLSL